MKKMKLHLENEMRVEVTDKRSEATEESGSLF